MRNFRHLWLLVPVLACAFLVWTHVSRIRRVDFVTGLDQDAVSGLPGRTLVVPGHRGESYDLIGQVQEMSRRGDWRVTKVDYENAPEGRTVEGASAVRWYLAALARIEHTITGRAREVAVERAAVLAEPLLHLTILLAATGLVVWRFGEAVGALLSLGLVALFPFAGGFVAGAPANLTPLVAVEIGGLLSLLMGFSRMAEEAPSGRFRFGPGAWFGLAGIASGCGWWIDPFSQAVLAAGMLVGGVWGLRQRALPEKFRARLPALWRWWGVAGTLIITLAYAVDRSPTATDLGRLDQVHPLHAVAWLALAELLARLSAPMPGVRWRKGEWSAFAIAALGVASLPFALWLTDGSLLPQGRNDLRLNGLPGSAIASDLAAWYRDGGIQFWATLIPAMAALPAMRYVVAGGIDPVRRLFLLLAVGGFLAMTLAASFYLRWWVQVDAVLLVLMVATWARFAAERPATTAGWAVAGFLALLLPGLGQLLPRRAAELPVEEVNAMIEKDLARWLSRRAAGGAAPIVWAPPDTTVALHYYGGLRGIGTFARENTEGLTSAVRIARAASAPEALALFQRRGITHVVLPSWDPYFDGIVSATGDAAAATFLGTLRAGDLPNWLRPVPYQFRRIAGIEDYELIVCEVVDEQEEITALSRQAEYHAEMGQLAAAAAAAEALRRFPTDVGALTARAQVYAATGEARQRELVFADLRKRLAAGGDRYLAWDRRVSLAIVLARERDAERAFEQARRCVADMNPERLRNLNPGMLLNLQMLLRVLELPMRDPTLQSLARELLPFELRQRL